MDHFDYSDADSEHSLIDYNGYVPTVCRGHKK